MTTEPTVIVALKSTLELIVAWVFVFFFWKEYCLDAFRENVFDVRDQLFMYAADGNIDFQSPAYRMLRERMNVSLRYAHEFNLARLMLALSLPSFKSSAENEAWQEATKSLPAQVQDKLNTFRNSFVLAVLKYMTLRSFFLYLLVLLGVTVKTFHDLAKRYIFPKVVIGVERLESEALDEEITKGSGTNAIPIGAG